MTRHPIALLQAELHEFVVQTQTRLEGLLRSVGELKQAASETAIPAGPGGDERPAAASQDVTREPPPGGSLASPSTPQPTSHAPRSVSHNESEDAPQDHRLTEHDMSLATERLEAIKRRLAAQIENA